MQEEIKKAKIRLYYLLLKKRDLSDNEIDIAFYLVKDRDIQEVLENGKTEKR